MGSKQLLTGAAFTDEKFPIIYDDSRLTDGSLMLFDASHSLAALTAPPVHDQFVNNIAGNTAVSVIPDATPENTAFQMYNTFSNGSCVFELTGKGAIHGAVKNADQAGGRAYLKISDKMRDYFIANPNRDYALFAWTNCTRVTTSGSNFLDITTFYNSVSAASNSLLFDGLANTVGRERTTKNAPTGMSGSPNATPALNQGQIFAWGNANPYDSLNANVGRSVIVYGVHVIDVAASGMTFAELDARDAALYAEAFAAGGRYYDDTFTDPDVLAPE